MFLLQTLGVKGFQIQPDHSYLKAVEITHLKNKPRVKCFHHLIARNQYPDIGKQYLSLHMRKQGLLWGLDWAKGRPHWLPVGKARDFSAEDIIIF